MARAIRSIVACVVLVVHSGAWGQDSVRASTNASAASVFAVSVLPASMAVLSVHAGAVMVVESIKAVGSLVEVVFKGIGNASRAVVTVTAAAATSVGLAVGQSVNVVAEGSGYVLMAAGKVLCYVPGDADKDLLRSERSK